jgi:catechol 2,3-dioxygenase-like lactoylglutathione lyase family enzyme
MRILEIAFTGFPVTDLERARAFYEGVLGLKVSHLFGDETTAWVEYDIGAGTLSIGNGLPEWKPSRGGGSVGLEVNDFEAAVQCLKANQVPFYIEPAETPVCRLAVVGDPDGNAIIIHKRKAAVAKND